MIRQLYITVLTDWGIFWQLGFVGVLFIEDSCSNYNDIVPDWQTALHDKYIVNYDLHIIIIIYLKHLVFDLVGAFLYNFHTVFFFM